MRLPEDVLAVILGLLRHLPSLMAARLVCRLLRKVSYLVITRLHIAAGVTLPDLTTAAQLEALPCLTSLCLHGDLQDRGDLLALPCFAQLLRELDIVLNSNTPQATRVFSAELKIATGSRGFR